MLEIPAPTDPPNQEWRGLGDGEGRGGGIGIGREYSVRGVTPTHRSCGGRVRGCGGNGPPLSLSLSPSANPIGSFSG